MLDEAVLNVTVTFTLPEFSIVEAFAILILGCNAK